VRVRGACRFVAESSIEDRMTKEQQAEVRGVVAQLRHAYWHLKRGTLGDQQAFADGLIGRSIQKLERLADGEMPPPCPICKSQAIGERA
jgi:hypothetical protein